MINIFLQIINIHCGEVHYSGIRTCRGSHNVMYGTRGWAAISWIRVTVVLARWRAASNWQSRAGCGTNRTMSCTRRCTKSYSAIIPKVHEDSSWYLMLILVFGFETFCLRPPNVTLDKGCGVRINVPPLIKGLSCLELEVRYLSKYRFVSWNWILQTNKTMHIPVLFFQPFPL